VTHEDGNGHEHDQSPGGDRRAPLGYTTDKDFFLTVLRERRRAHDAEHESHDEQHISEQQLLTFARETLESRVAEAANNVDERNKVIADRLDRLESGGAPFASRLDESLKTLKSDVETLKSDGITSETFKSLVSDVDSLKTEAVRQTALDTLRQQNSEKIESQRKQIKYVLIAAGLSFAISLVLLGVQVLGSTGN
jgi:chemotaxis regulatin CheY-phosphate phosphatase CheZ